MDSILIYLKEVGSIIEFCWIPGHIGSNKIAKEVIDWPIYDVKLPFSDLTPRICRYVNSIFQENWNNCCTNKLHEIKENVSSTMQLYSNNH